LVVAFSRARKLHFESGVASSSNNSVPNKSDEALRKFLPENLIPTSETPSREE
jgi:hypothetical protein